MRQFVDLVVCSSPSQVGSNPLCILKEKDAGEVLEEEKKSK